MLDHFKRALVLAPHTDDGELGAGGTIARLTDSGCEVHYAAFSTCEESVPAPLPRDILETEVKNATAKLGIAPQHLHVFKFKVRKMSYVRQEILEDLVLLRNRHKFDLVLMPSLNDIHQDHAVVAHEGLRAFKNTTLLSYELICNNLQFSTCAFVSLEEKHLLRKIDALNAYESQKGRSYMSGEFVSSLAIARGVQIGTRYAEAFEVVRWVIR